MSGDMDIDGKQLLKDLESLAEFGKGRDGGVSRIAYGPADLEARQWVIDRIKDLEVPVRVDVAGNTIARLPGTDDTLNPLAIGSHTDSVANGGRFDGALGVMAGLSILRALVKNNRRLRHPFELINFAAEEATNTGGTFGSRAMAGMLDDDELSQTGQNGKPLSDVLCSAGLDPDQLGQAKREPGSIAGYLELHIEQGKELAAHNAVIGVVTGMAGIRRYRFEFNGESNHAGSTRMEDRRDALVAAAELIRMTSQISRKLQLRGTVGVLESPNSGPSIIPGWSRGQLELRGMEEEAIDEAESQLTAWTEQMDGSLTRCIKKDSVKSDSDLFEFVRRSAGLLNLQCHSMFSGGGHDGRSMARLGPQALIFVPSRNGVSHSPDEFTENEHCIAGARTLLKALLLADKSPG